MGQQEHFRKAPAGAKEIIGYTIGRNALARIFDDETHSAEERREIIIGHSILNRLILVSFTERADRIRILSARPATPKERKDYEENTTIQET